MKKSALVVLTGLLALSIPLSSIRGWAQPVPDNSIQQTGAVQSTGSGMSSGKPDGPPTPSGADSGKPPGPTPPSGSSSGKPPGPKPPSGMSSGKPEPAPYQIKNLGTQGMNNTPAPVLHPDLTPAPQMMGGYQMSPVGKDGSILMPPQGNGFQAPQGMNVLSVPSIPSPVSGAGGLSTPATKPGAIDAPAMFSPVNTGASHLKSPAVQIAPVTKSGDAQKNMLPGLNHLH